MEDAHEKLVKLPGAEADIQETPPGLDGFSFHTGPKVNQSERRAFHALSISEINVKLDDYFRLVY